MRPWCPDERTGCEGFRNERVELIGQVRAPVKVGVRRKAGGLENPTKASALT